MNQSEFGGNIYPMLKIKYVYLVICLIVAYTLIFGYISIAKYYAMNSDVWDLGYAYGYLGRFAFGYDSYRDYLNLVFYQGIIYIIFPIAYMKSIPALLIFQVIMLALPMYFIYEISRLYKINDQRSFLISLCYFFYFPLAGAIWFDFHFQTSFILLFVVGYWLYLKERKVTSGFFFVLSGLVRFPYMGVVIFAIFSIIVFDTLNNSNNSMLQLKKVKFNFLYVIFLFTIAIFIVQFLWISYNNPSLNNTHISGNFNPFINFNSKLLTFLIIFGFLLFVPLFSLKWTIPTLPFLFLVFFSNNTGYYYPILFSDWYVVSIVPFLFLGLIEVISKTGKSRLKNNFFKELKTNIGSSTILKWIYNATVDRTILRLKIKWNKTFTKKNIIYFIVLILVSSSLIVEPYGPLNNHSFNNFNTKEELNYNLSLYQCSLKIINLIPYNEKYVLVQNDLPQLFVHDLYIKHIEVSPYNLGPNITNMDIKLNNFPFNGGSGYPKYIKVNFVLVNLNNILSLTEPPYNRYFPTMDQIFEKLLESKFYGIEAYGNGIVLLKRGYTENPKIFNMSKININLKQLQLHGASYNNGKIEISTNNKDDASIYGPFPYLRFIPLNYSLVINLTYHVKYNSTFVLKVGWIGKNESFNSLKNEEFKFTNDTDRYHDLIVNFSITNFTSTFQIDMYFDSNESQVSINSMYIYPREMLT